MQNGMSNGRDSRRAWWRRGAPAAWFFTALLAWAGPGLAAPVTLLQDGFNSENGGVGAAEYSGFANFTAANIDLLAPGYFFNLCQAAGGSTPCLDLEGSGNGSLTTRTAYALPAGPVTISFALAGDQRGRGNNNVTVSLVSELGQVLFSEVFTAAADQDFVVITRSFDLAAAAPARLRFLSGGPADSMGLLLDDVTLIAGGSTGPGPDPQPVPEPASLALLGFGLVGLGVARRGTRRR